MELPPRFNTALDTIIAEIRTIAEPVGILLTGSVIHGNAAPTSDLDVAVLWDRPGRQRIQRVIGGAPIECFCNSYAWWMDTLKGEVATGRAPSAHFLARGVIVHDTDARMRALQEAAARVVAGGPLPGEDLLKQMRYGAVTALEDGEDIALIDPERALHLLHDAIDKALRYRYLTDRIWIPREKDLFTDAEARWPRLGVHVRAAYRGGGIRLTIDHATAVVQETTGHVRFFDWESSLREDDPDEAPLFPERQ